VLWQAGRKQRHAEFGLNGIGIPFFFFTIMFFLALPQKERKSASLAKALFGSERTKYHPIDPKIGPGFPAF